MRKKLFEFKFYFNDQILSINREDGSFKGNSSANIENNQELKTCFKKILLSATNKSIFNFKEFLKDINIDFMSFITENFSIDEIESLKFRRNSSIKDILKIGSSGLKNIVEQSGFRIKDIFEPEKEVKTETIKNNEKPLKYAKGGF